MIIRTRSCLSKSNIYLKFVAEILPFKSFKDNLLVFPPATVWSLKGPIGRMIIVTITPVSDRVVSLLYFAVTEIVLDLLFTIFDWKMLLIFVRSTEFFGRSNVYNSFVWSIITAFFCQNFFFLKHYLSREWCPQSDAFCGWITAFISLWWLIPHVCIKTLAKCCQRFSVISLAGNFSMNSLNFFLERNDFFVIFLDKKLFSKFQKRIFTINDLNFNLKLLSR